MCLADFGEGVLDATVETAAYVLRKGKAHADRSVFFRQLISETKQHDLLSSIATLAGGHKDNATFLADTGSFNGIPNSPFTYWVPDTTISHLRTFPPLEGTIATVRVGLQTGEDARFLRMVWEVPSESIGALMNSHDTGTEGYVDRVRSTFRKGKRWAFYSKTDYASPWLSPLTMVVDWHNDGDMLKAHIRARGYSPSKWVQSEDKYFAPGFSYMVRSTRLVPFVVPPGVIPMAVRSQVYPAQGCETKAIGICASRIGSAIARFSGGAFARPMFQASMVQNISTLPMAKATEVELQRVINQFVGNARALLGQFEPWQEFQLPAFLADAAPKEVTWQLNTLVGANIEGLIARDASLTEEQASALCRDLDEAILIRTQKANTNETSEDDGESEGDDEDEDNSQSILDFSDRAVAEGFVSYLVGIAFGRWDIRFALDRSLLPKAQGMLDPLPVCPPGMLAGSDGLPASIHNIASEEWLRARPSASFVPDVASLTEQSIRADEYPFPIQWDGIMPDDSTSSSDIVLLVHQAFEATTNEKGTLRGEEWLCDLLGIKGLREYFRKSGKGGFWDDHVNRYKAKRGRKAPIYWLLQSTRRNYSLWLYYHRLDNDMLFKALVNYVEPKIRLETNRFDSLHSQKVATGENGKEAKRLAKEVERQEDVLSELRDFEDKLRRAANLHVVPDLNDGVVLNIAPLWELVPWKEAKSYWDELLKGEYEWSSIGKQLRQKGLVK